MGLAVGSGTGSTASGATEGIAAGLSTALGVGQPAQGPLSAIPALAAAIMVPGGSPWASAARDTLSVYALERAALSWPVAAAATLAPWAAP